MVKKSFFRAINEQRIISRGLPYKGSFEITYKCNYRCIHCSTSCDFSDKKELSTASVFKILKDIRDAGCLWLTITGGEPLIRKDFLDIYLYAKKMGFVITLLTNATLLDKKLITRLEKNPPLQVQLSILGVTENVYEKVSGVKGSFSRFRNGLSLLLKSDLRIGMLRMPLLKVNRHELFIAKDYARKLGIDFDYYLYVDPTIIHEDRVMKQGLSAEELVKVELSDGLLDRWKQDYFCYKEGKSIKKCLFERVHRAFIINAFGEFNNTRRFPCIPLVFDLTKIKFSSAWKQYLAQAEQQVDSFDCVCKECEIFRFCYQCASHSVLSRQGSVFRDYHCQVTRARLKALEEHFR
ncbi:MAG: radical SAM protein [Candidatus Omnitrophica bacterium]|nr:radical SAM protein [Candidatus Omnitrophota bacterium]